MVSSGRNPKVNEDAASYASSHFSLTFWVIDGSSSVADHNYIEEKRDVVWFSSQFNGGLKECVEQNVALDEMIDLTSVRTAELYTQLVYDVSQVPSYALPSASLSLAQVNWNSNEVLLNLFELGDCTTLVKCGDTGDVGVFGGGWNSDTEHELRDASVALRQKGITSEEDVKKALLQQLRQRRTTLNTMARPIVLTLKPHDGFSIRKHSRLLKEGDSILVMSDGFYRAVELYQLMDHETLFKIVAKEGLETVVAQLRAHEQAMDSRETAAVKSADDASAVYVRLGNE